MSYKLIHVLSYCGVSVAYNKRKYDHKYNNFECICYAKEIAPFWIPDYWPEFRDRERQRKKTYTLSFQSCAYRSLPVTSIHNWMARYFSFKIIKQMFLK